MFDTEKIIEQCSDISNLKRLVGVIVISFVTWFIGIPLSNFITELLHSETFIINTNIFWFSYIFIVLIINIISILLLFKSKYRISNIEAILLFESIILYISFIHYFTKNNWPALLTSSFTIAALSVLFVTLLYTFAGLLTIRFTSINSFNSKENLFLDDDPLTRKENTTYVYENLISKISPILFEDKYESAFSIGIIGSWGSGKSSFINEVADKINEHQKVSFWKRNEKYQEVIYVKFSPFLNHNENQVIHEFFIQLSNELKKRSGKLSNLLVTYSEQLSNIEPVGNVISWLKPSFESKESVSELYNNISEIIRELNIKIIISIDDLDRLNAKEILQVLKLIRNTSNFPNVVFLVALDKRYVLETLKNEREYMTEQYLNKFFQLEINTSKISCHTLEKLIKENILQKLRAQQLNAKNLNELENILDNQLFSIFIFNYRDAKRFINQFVLDFLLIHQVVDLNSNLVDIINIKEIDYDDLVNITLLKIFYPETFENLKHTPELIISQNNLDRDIWELPTTNTDSNMVLQTVSPKQIKFIEDLNDYNLNDKEGLIKVRLFGLVDEVKLSQSSIKRNKVIKLYFERSLSDFELSEKRFEEYYNSEDESLESIISKIKANSITFEYFITRVRRKQCVSDRDKIKKIKIQTELYINQDIDRKTILHDIIEELKNLSESNFLEICKFILNNKRLSEDKKVLFILEYGEIISNMEVIFKNNSKILEIFKLISSSKINTKLYIIESLINRYFLNNQFIRESLYTYIRKFVEKNSMIDFCQNVIYDPHSEFKSFAVKPIIQRIYHSIDLFNEAVRTHSESNTFELLEVNEFLSVFSLINDIEKINFQFRFKHLKVSSNYQFDDSIIQVFLKSEFISVFDENFKSQMNTYQSIQILSYELFGLDREKECLLFTCDNISTYNMVMKLIYEIAKEKVKPTSSPILLSGKIGDTIIFGDTTIIKTLSIHPSLSSGHYDIFDL